MTNDTKLPAADWTRRRGLAALLTALDGQSLDGDGRGGAPRYVGGAVRDTLLGLDVKDVDMATPLRPEQVMERLKAADIKVIPTGIDHGTVTAVLPDGPVEITTLRRDVATDGRHATVAFSDDWKEDAARRDFTINALFADPETLQVFDYFGGLDDLKMRRIRFIGAAQDRIAEDHLRIMRYFRFLARFGVDEVEAEAFQACSNASPKLETLSRERIADELMKLLGTDDPVFAVQQMIAGHILDNIVSECDPDAGTKLARLIQREKIHDVAASAVRRLAAVLPKHGDQAADITKSLRMSKKLQKAIAARLTTSVTPAQAGNTPTPTTIRALAYWHGVPAARDRALLFGAEEDVAAMLDQLKGWEPPAFPLTGGDLIARGMEPGPEVSQTLAKLERKWVESGFSKEISSTT